MVQRCRLVVKPGVTPEASLIFSQHSPPVSRVVRRILPACVVKPGGNFLRRFDGLVRAAGKSFCGPCNINFGTAPRGWVEIHKERAACELPMAAAAITRAKSGGRGLLIEFSKAAAHLVAMSSLYSRPSTSAAFVWIACNSASRSFQAFTSGRTRAPWVSSRFMRPSFRV